MKSLVKTLFNIENSTWHPIMYFEYPFLGEYNKSNPTRYKSKGHHTTGFTNRQAAIDYINASLIPTIKDKTIYTDITVELEEDIIWSGVDIPADVQIR